MSEPRQLTDEEARERFLAMVWSYVDYWAREGEELTQRERLSRLAFSLLAMLDGTAVEVPGWLVIPDPHSDDREYARARGENWYRDTAEGQDEGDIAGVLHEVFYQHPGRGSLP